MPTYSLDNLLGARFFNQYIGFDPFFKSIGSVMENTANASYPPPDIVNQRDGVYAITLALAGFEKEDLSITLKGQTLSICGNLASSNGNEKYAHRGIAKRNFQKVFALGRHTEVENVVLKNGLLTVHLKEVIPESQKLRQIDIIDD